MTAIYYALIVFPLIFFIFEGFVFGLFTGSSPAISNQQYLINCPLPLQNQNTVNATITNNQLTYAALAPGQTVGNNTNVGTFFYCFIAGQGAPAATVQIRNYGQTVAAFPIGWFQYVGDTIGQLLGKIPLTIQLVYLFFTVPADVSGIVWFTLVNAVLLMLFTLGVYMLIRSG